MFVDVVVDSSVRNGSIGRSEVFGSVVFGSATPSRVDVRKAVSKNLKVDEGLVVVKRLGNVFGGGSAKFCVFVYDDKDKLVFFEQKYMVDRNFPSVKKSEVDKSDDSSKGSSGDVKKEDVKSEEKPVEKNEKSDSENGDKKVEDGS